MLPKSTISTPLQFTDTHAHLYVRQYGNDRTAMIDRAIAAGVTRMLLPNIDVDSIPALYQLADAYPQNCFPMMGLHPCDVKADAKEALDYIENELYHSGRSFCAIGEIGLDFYWDTTYAQAQEQALHRQIEWAKKLDLPIVLHCRNSFDQTLAIVQEHNDSQLRGVFHCFSTSTADAEKVIKLGNFYIGIGGVVTYPNSGVSEIVKNIDLNYIILETDAPFLVPEPHRSRNKKQRPLNESAFLVDIAQCVAELKQTDLATIAEITNENATQLFRLNVPSLLQ